MTAWRTEPAERRELFTPIALQLRDDFTGLAPQGPISTFVDLREGLATWRPQTHQPVVTARGVLTYPQLDRRAEVVGVPPRRYRFRLAARFYRPFYGATADGIEFDAFAYNDVEPPPTFATQLTDVVLTPSVAYPFPTHVPVLRGVVHDLANAPVRDVVVSEGVRERVLTDERGEFALPLRWVVEGMLTPIDGEDLRTGRTGTILIVLPVALGITHTIIIS